MTDFNSGYPLPSASVADPFASPPTANEYAPFAAIEFGDILGTTMRVIGRNFVPFFAITVGCLIPAFALNAFMQIWLIGEFADIFGGGLYDPYGSSLGSPDEYLHELMGVMGTMTGALLAAAFVRLVLAAAAQAPMTGSTVAQLGGEQPSIMEAVRRSWPRVPAAVMAVFVKQVLITLGLPFCAVPSIIFACMFFLVAEVVVLEACGPIEAFSRSIELTRGNRLTLFAAGLVVYLGFIMFSCVINGVTGQLASTEDPFAIGPSTYLELGFQYFLETVQAVVFAVMGAVVYARIRGVRDGVDAQSLAQVFR